MRLSIRLTVEHLKNSFLGFPPPPLPHPRTPGPGASAAPLWDWRGDVLPPSVRSQKREVRGTVLFTHSLGLISRMAWKYQGICHFLGYQAVILNLTR